MQLETEVWLQKSWKTFAQLLLLNTQLTSHPTITALREQQWLGTMLEKHESIGAAELFTIVPGGWSCQNPILASPWWFFQRGKVMRNNTMLTIPRPNFLVSPVVSGIPCQFRHQSPQPKQQSGTWQKKTHNIFCNMALGKWHGRWTITKNAKISNPCRAAIATGEGCFLFEAVPWCISHSPSHKFLAAFAEKTLPGFPT